MLSAQQPTGKGHQSVVIPSDPIALLDQFNLLMESRKAGNMGVPNNFISICDELKQQKIFYKSTYKELAMKLK